MEKKLRLGIIGCAKIVENAIINPSKYIDAVELYAIASRDPENARRFSNKYSIKVPLQSYQEILDDPNVDFVYIALPNTMHSEWAMKAAAAKKHVLVEKPLCVDAKEIGVLKDICDKNGVYLMEGLMVQHHPWQKEISKIIENKLYGTLRKIHTHISFTPKYDLAKNYRSDPEKGGGSFYDLSPYWLQFLQTIKDIKNVPYDGISLFDGPNNCDMTFKASLTFSDGLASTLETSFEKPYEATHALYFDTATLTIKDMFRSNIGQFKIALAIENHHTKKMEIKYFPPSNYYENQLLYFIEVIRDKKPNIPLEQSMERIALMGKIYKQAYNKFKMEKKYHAL